MDRAQQLVLPAPRLKPRKPPPALERDTQIVFASYLRYALRRDVWWTHIASGEYRAPATAALLKRLGVNPGWPDFIFLDGLGRVAFLESKRGKLGRLTTEQAAFARVCVERGVRYALALSFTDAEAAVKRWGLLL